MKHLCNTVILLRQSTELSKMSMDLMLFLVVLLWCLEVIFSRFFQSLRRVQGQRLLEHVFRDAIYGLHFKFSTSIRICASMLTLSRGRTLHSGNWMLVMECTQMSSATSNFWTV